MPRVEFAHFDRTERKAVKKITARAVQMFRRYGVQYPRRAMDMDLAAVHHSCPLDLVKLANFPDFDFAHDMGGIRANLNRKTGELDNHFTPRCAKPQRREVQWEDLSARPRGILLDAGFSSPHDAFVRGREKLMLHKGFGAKSWEELEALFPPEPEPKPIMDVVRALKARHAN